MFDRHTHTHTHTRHPLPVKHLSVCPTSVYQTSHICLCVTNLSVCLSSFNHMSHMSVYPSPFVTQHSVKHLSVSFHVYIFYFLRISRLTMTLRVCGLCVCVCGLCVRLWVCVSFYVLVCIYGNCSITIMSDPLRENKKERTDTINASASVY